jgi:phosphate transport system protein
MPMQHTVKAYDQDLKRIKATISEMAGLVETQLADALEALARNDMDAATRCIEADARVDALDRMVEHLSIQFLALRQPMAEDLRIAVSSIKIAGEIERIGDYAKNIAKRMIRLGHMAELRPATTIARMGRMVRPLVKDVFDAFVEADAVKAMAVWRRDAEIDEMHTSVFRELLTYMMEDPRTITVCTHLLFVAKNLERIGDHATNVAELVAYQVDGHMPADDRPKGDRSVEAIERTDP